MILNRSEKTLDMKSDVRRPFGRRRHRWMSNVRVNVMKKMRGVIGLVVGPGCGSVAGCKIRG